LPRGKYHHYKVQNKLENLLNTFNYANAIFYFLCIPEFLTFPL
jgi:hypothetical protein